MIELRHSLDPVITAAKASVDLATADAVQLDYELFCGDVHFRVDDANFDANWAWIPLLHFIDEIVLATKQLILEGHSKIDFTESDATIDFERSGSIVTISANYTSAVAQAPLTELVSAVRDFATKALSDLETEWPDLRSNQTFNRRLHDIETILKLLADGC